MYKLKNRKIYRQFAVITGHDAQSVPVILVQRVFYLVNKFAILFKKSMFHQDCRNASGNDCAGTLVYVFFKFFKLLNRMYHPGSSANELTLKAKDDNRSVLQSGRSMIEMLGVLAIIAVLSVGGIAGYSKAMEKIKINSILNDYRNILFSLYENRENILKSTPDGQTGLIYIIKSLQLIPKQWRIAGHSIIIFDSLDNEVALYSMRTPQYGKNISMDIYLGGYWLGDKNNIINQKFSNKLCVEFLSNFAQPLHGYIVSAGYTDWFNDKNSKSWYGDAFCSNKKCIAAATIADFQKACSNCTDKRGSCIVSLRF